jgi:acyl-CoA synthetase (AMP-forming)/AMP-acid ligase II
MVLAPGGDRELLGWALCRRTFWLAWHGILSEMGMVVVSSTLAVGGIAHVFDAEGEPPERAVRRLRRASRDLRPIMLDGPIQLATSVNGLPHPIEAGDCRSFPPYVTPVITQFAKA